MLPAMASSGSRSPSSIEYGVAGRVIVQIVARPGGESLTSTGRLGLKAPLLFGT